MKSFLKIIQYVLFYLIMGCAHIDEGLTINPGERPAEDSLEAGLWMQVEKVEEATKRSGRLVTDKKLNSYIKNIVCQLAGTYCPDIRVYILNVNVFNAAMFPNGMMHIFTGLLLRVQNESRLASVLGHEITHYVKRHGLKQFIDTQGKADALAVLSAALYSTGVGATANLATLLAQGTIAAYSRDHEREADTGGLEILVREGYSPIGAPEIWEYIAMENEANPDKGSVSMFLASHPPTEERIKNLRKQASSIKFTKTPKIGETDFLEATSHLRGKWFEDELLRGQFEQSKIVLQNMQSSKLHPGEIHFFRGEIIRKEVEEDFILKSIEQYQKAIDLDGSDPRPRKAIGLMLMKIDQNERAAEHLKMYLNLNSDAEDFQVIQMYLDKINS